MKTKKWKYQIALIVGIFTLFGLIDAYSETPKEKKTISARQVLPCNMPIVIYDGTKPVKISLEDIGKIHGHICPCVLVAFRSMQKVMCLWRGKHLQRDDLMIITAHPSDGIEDAFDFVTKAKTGKNRKGDFKVKLPLGSKAKEIGPDNYTFTFTRKSTGDTLVIKLRKEVFPKNFFELRKKSILGNPEDKKAFTKAKEMLQNRLMSWPCHKLFICEKQ